MAFWRSGLPFASFLAHLALAILLLTFAAHLGHTRATYTYWHGGGFGGRDNACQIKLENNRYDSDFPFIGCGGHGRVGVHACSSWTPSARRNCDLRGGKNESAVDFICKRDEGRGMPSAAGTASAAREPEQNLNGPALCRRCGRSSFGPTRDTHNDNEGQKILPDVPS